MNEKQIKQIINKCIECKITSRSIYIITNNNIGCTNSINFAINNDINKIKIYFLYEFIIYQTRFLNLFKQNPKIRNEFIDGSIRDDLNSIELEFEAHFKKVINAKEYDDVINEIYNFTSFMNEIGYNLTAMIYDDRVEAYKKCIELEREYNFEIKFKKILLDYDKNLIEIK